MGAGQLQLGAELCGGWAEPGVLRSGRGGARWHRLGECSGTPASHSPPSPQEQQYARWMAACRLASKGRTMADSSYSSEVQAILAFLNLQRSGGGSGGPTQGPDAATDGFNPYGLVAPRFQRKLKAKQVPRGWEQSWGLLCPPGPQNRRAPSSGMHQYLHMGPWEGVLVPMLQERSCMHDPPKALLRSCGQGARDL